MNINNKNINTKKVNIENEYANKEFGDALKDLMEQRNQLTYRKLAYMCKDELSIPFLQQMVKKKVLPPKDKFMEVIAAALGIRPDYFMEYRLRRCTEYLKKNPEYLNECYAKIKGAL